MNLANKYRPKTWQDITEQTLVWHMLESLCTMPTLPNRNFLLIGPAGCGKTTMARIIANTINDGKGEPVEIDAASHNGVDAMREIVVQASQFPIGSKYKVFIIDECHVLTTAGWSVLLKCLEESPARSVFIFCTTNPEKIPNTILSRVQTFQLSKISLDGIVNRLKYVLDTEISNGIDISYTIDAINYIAKLANGGMRDALTLLDKALAYSNNITIENLSKALNLPNYDDYFALLSAYAKKDNMQIIQIVHNIYNSGVNFIKWFEGFHAFIMNVVKYIFVPNIQLTMIPSYYELKISKYGTAHVVICLSLANKVLELNQALKTTQYLQEMALTYLCHTPKKG